MDLSRLLAKHRTVSELSLSRLSLCSDSMRIKTHGKRGDTIFSIPFQVPGILTFEIPLILLTGWCTNPQTDVYPCSSVIVELLPTYPVALFPLDGWCCKDAASKIRVFID